MEKIYTIPVNESFDECAADHSLGCPFCRLHDKLESNELEIILGASMMEPDIRQKTNESGFCRHHYDMMFVRKNRLGMALLLESHLDTVRASMESGGLQSLLRPQGAAASERIKKLGEACYVCARIDYSLTKMIENAVYLWEADSGQRLNPFEEKIKKQPYFCLPHYRRFSECGREQINKKKYAAFFTVITSVTTSYFDQIRGDISWFIKNLTTATKTNPGATQRTQSNVRFYS